MGALSHRSCLIVNRTRGSHIERDRTLELDLSPHPSSVARARSFVTEALEQWAVPEETEQLARLAISELVTNAIVHAGTHVVVRVRPEVDAVWVGVTDQNDSLPVRQTTEPDHVGNRGLAIVDAVARRWGVDQQFSRPGKTVWFTVALDP